MSPDIGAGGASTPRMVALHQRRGTPDALPYLADQVEVLNAIALLSVTAPVQARDQLVRTLPLCEVHSSVTWVWHVLMHHCGRRMHAATAAAPAAGGKAEGTWA